MNKTTPKNSLFLANQGLFAPCHYHFLPSGWQKCTISYDIYFLFFSPQKFSAKKNTKNRQFCVFTNDLR